MDNIRLSPPWVTYVNELEAMFGQDADITIRYDEAEREVKMFVSDVTKAYALIKLLPREKTNENDDDILDTFQKAFKGNPVLEYVYDAKTPLGEYRYVVFANKVVQFFNDQIDDINGYKTTLYQEIAKELFNDDLGVNYCTEPMDVE